ncbi:hypothetical protein MMC07_002618 [Pseudocyphellaria aurata]|nr:hypothetical protein [Pseudocyphellaria aurata]
MEAASKHDPQCAPNVISYSAVMTACCMGGHPAKAEDWFKHMRARNIKPDHICYSTLIAGEWTSCPMLQWTQSRQIVNAVLLCFEKFSNMDQARFYHDEMVRAGMTPRASQSLDAGMTAADSSAVRAAKPLGLTPLGTRASLPSKPLTINTTPHHPSASRLGASMPSYQAPDTGMSLMDPLDSIPAYFGGHGGLGMQNDESTMELRRNMLRTRHACCLGEVVCIEGQQTGTEMIMMIRPMPS